MQINISKTDFHFIFIFWCTLENKKEKEEEEEREKVLVHSQTRNFSKHVELPISVVVSA
jgi:hypothetical protein